MITRTNFLDLLGADTRKYRSCIITSYSFDILYFEQIVLPRLRKAGILNVNLFVDAGMFQNQLAQYSGKEYIKPTRDYSITPVKMRGAFHPKMMLAIGKTKGFLAVGSGNITASGISNNEEIWSAFHYNSSVPVMEPIFHKAITYLSQLQAFAYGVNSKKLDWIPEHSNWYRGMLEEPLPEGIIELRDTSYELMTSNADTSFVKTLRDALPEKPLNIKILSPFYNQSGDLLKKLLEVFDPERIHCIIDPESGSFPRRMPPNSRIDFFNWTSLQGSKNGKKLHAKALQFEYVDQTIFLAGSANATTEAFGTELLQSTNAEAIIKITSKKKVDFFSELGILFPKTALVDLSSLPPTSQEKLPQELEVEIYISHAEYQNQRINFILNSQLPETILRIEDADAQIIFEVTLPAQDSQFSIQVEDIQSEDIFRLAFWRGDHKISNYCFVSNAIALLNTNTDERLARFNEIRNQEFFDDLGIETFLDFLNSEKLFERSRSSDPKLKETPEEEKVPDSISTEEFNKNASNIDPYSSRQTQLTSLIEDFLSQLVFGSQDKEQISDNVEEVAIQNSEEGTESGKLSHIQRELSFSDGMRICRKLDKVLLKISKYFVDSTAAFHTSKEKNLPEEQKLSTQHINALLIGFSLILKYLPDTFSQTSYELKIKFTESGSLKKLEEEFKLIRHEKQLGNRRGFVNYDVDSSVVEELKTHIEKEKTLSLISLNTEIVKQLKHYYYEPFWAKNDSTDFIIHSLSLFLYAQLKKLTTYNQEEEEQYKDKVKKLQDLSILLISSYWCSKNGRELRDLLALNIFYITGFDKTPGEMQIYLVKLTAKQQKQTGYEEENMNQLLLLYKKYYKFKKASIEAPKTFTRPLNSLIEGNMIFSSKYGFCVLEKVKKDGFINLHSPLGKQHSLSGLYGFENVYIGKAVKVFPSKISADKV